MDKPTNRPLLYIDFLGFSEKILSQTIEESLEYYLEILGYFEIFKQAEPEFKVNFDVISDSVFFWIEGNNLLTTTKKLFQVAVSLMHNSYFNKLPLRGSIVFDDFMLGDKEFEISNNKVKTHIILGKAIISGYKWEQTQNWFGISINPLYLKKFEDELPGFLGSQLNVHYIIDYDIPTKYGEIKSYAINGFMKYFAEGGKYAVEGTTTMREVPTYSIKIKELKNEVKDFSVLSKITNTEKYLEYVMSKNLYREPPE